MTDWEGGERQGIRWRRTGAVVLVLALAGGAYYVSRETNELSIDTGNTPVEGVDEDDVEVVQVAPLEAGDRFYCPPTHSVVAFDDGNFYPPEYPREVATQRPAACFVEVERAEAAGYELADPPPGVVVAGGVYLEPTRSPTLEACESLAESVGFRVPCPTRLPTPSFGPSCTADSCVYDDGSGEGVVIEHARFDVPADWPAAARGASVKVAAVELAQRDDEEADSLDVLGPHELVSCGQGQPVVADRQPTFTYCGAGGQMWVPRIQGDPHQGATAAFWRDDEVVYGVSVSGEGARVEELLHAMLDGIGYVEP